MYALATAELENTSLFILQLSGVLPLLFADKKVYSELDIVGWYMVCEDSEHVDIPKGEHVHRKVSSGSANSPFATSSLA